MNALRHSPTLVRAALGAGGLALAIGLGGVLWARSGATAPKPPPVSGPVMELRVPHVVGNISLDGDMDDSGWMGPQARTFGFVTPNGSEARPYSEARIVWGDGHLYLGLYAADEDIRVGSAGADGPLWLADSFQLVFTSGSTQRLIDISALGTVTDGKREALGFVDYGWQSNAHVSHELDGTLNDPSDDDEEWALEVAIPFESLGLEGQPGDMIGFSVRRCDRPKDMPRTCASWGEGDLHGLLVLE